MPAKIFLRATTTCMPGVGFSTLWICSTSTIPATTKTVDLRWLNPSACTWTSSRHLHWYFLCKVFDRRDLRLDFRSQASHRDWPLKPYTHPVDTPVIFELTAFALGLLFGSFLNVCISRLP